MKKKIWKLGIGLTILLCGFQFLMGAGGVKGTERFTIESRASLPSPVKKRSIRKWYYYYNVKRKRYEKNTDETELCFALGGFTTDISCGPREGYVLKKMYVNGESVPIDTTQYYVTGNLEVEFYFDRLPSCNQVYRYYTYNPKKSTYQLDRSIRDSMPGGIYYTTRISFDEQKYHIQKIMFNGSEKAEVGDFTYLTTGDNEIDVYLYPNRTILEFYDDTGKRAGTQTVLYGEKTKLMANTLKKPCYQFVGWKGTILGETRMFQDQEEFETPYTEDLTILKLVAEWKPMEYRITLRYHSDTGPSAATYVAGPYEWEDSFCIWQQSSFPKAVEDAVLLGWTMQPDQKEVRYQTGQLLSTRTLFYEAREQSMTDPEKTEQMIDLYPLWDRAPVLKISHVYISSKDARDGKITKQYLYQQLKAVDPEEGELALLAQEDSGAAGISFPDYRGSLFLEGQTGDVKITVKARDSGGNEVMEQMVCSIVDSNGSYLGKMKRVRFISKEYLDTLDEDSVWRTNRQYVRLLEEVLEKAS